MKARRGILTVDEVDDAKYLCGLFNAMYDELRRLERNREGDCVRIRLAGPGDAEQLFALNERFNGRGETSPADIEKSLADNRREIVVVAEEGSALVGFVCVQIKKSFCYRAPSAEITEVFVEDRYRRKKLASGMIRFAEAYCGENYPLHRWELLTGADNRAAQALYASVGYESEGEIHLAKRL